MKALDGKKPFSFDFWPPFFVPPSVVLCVFLVLFGVASDWLVSPGSVPPSSYPPSRSVPGAFWSSQFSAGPSFRVSGCILRRPVVMPGMECCEARLLSSLFLIATKASALCGALPSTPYCGCCSGAFLSCTEVFARATWGAISVDVCTFRRPKPIRGVEKAFRFWGGQGLSPSLM